MGSLEEIYWNMAKKQWKVGTHYAIMPSCDGNYLINNTLYMSASSLCSHNMPSCSHYVYNPLIMSVKYVFGPLEGLMMHNKGSFHLLLSAYLLSALFLIYVINIQMFINIQPFVFT